MKNENWFTNLVVFGDGLSDMGRWGALTNMKYPPAALGFYQSRWTNGKVWVEHLAHKLNLPVSFENNFAMGGATTGQYNINEPLRQLLRLDNDLQLDGMLAQVQSYLSANPNLDNHTLFILWAGGHDIANYLEYGQPDLGQHPSSKNYEDAISLLIDAGAKHIFIGTMPDMGYTPSYFGTERQETASKLCIELNQGLSKIQSQYQNTDVTIYKFDGAAIFSEIGANAQAYGIKYVNEAYLPDNVIDFTKPLERRSIPLPNQEKGLDPDEFMNWWAVSASAKVHQILGAQAFEFLMKALNAN